MYKYKVAVVMPVRNEAKYIHRSLSSVVNQLLEPKYIVVVDNGSTDPTPDIVKSYARVYSNISMIHVEPIGSYNPFAEASRAILAGISYINSIDNVDYITIVGADTALEYRYLKQVVGFVKDKPEIVIAGGITINEYHRPVYIRGTGMVIRKNYLDSLDHEIVETAIKENLPLDTLIQLEAIARGKKLALVKKALMKLLRPTRRPPPAILGKIDAWLCTDPAFALAKSLKYAKNPKNLLTYLYSYMKNYRKRIRRLCRAKGQMEKATIGVRKPSYLIVENNE